MLRSLTLPVPYRRSRPFPVHAIANRSKLKECGPTCSGPQLRPYNTSLASRSQKGAQSTPLRPELHYEGIQKGETRSCIPDNKIVISCALISERLIDNCRG